MFSLPAFRYFVSALAWFCYIQIGGVVFLALENGEMEWVAERFRSKPSGILLSSIWPVLVGFWFVGVISSRF